MSLFKLTAKYLAISFVLSLAITSARAQITTIGDDTSTPVHGSGHDYIKLLVETVNPANGSVSVRISVPVPKGRGLTLPFSFAYDTNGVNHLLPLGGNGQTFWASNTSYLGQGGWSYSAPMLTMRNWSVNKAPAGQPVDMCTYNSDYVFQDPSGGRHSLGIGTASWDTQQAFLCDHSYLNGGDAQFVATLQPAFTGDPGAPVSIADADGTVFYFGNPQAHPSSSSRFSLANWIEDRNGNKLTVTDNSNGSFSVTDTLGRTVISSSGFGPAGATNTVSVSGLSASYQITWGTASASYSVPSTLISGAGVCGGIPNVTNTQTVIQSITIPNGQKYQFFYDPTYGLLSQIVYPSGAWVKYTWKPSDQYSELAVYPDIYGNANGCTAQYAAPVVATRQVSFGSSSAVLTQSFNYTTTWASGGASWTQKTAKVTSTDNIRLETNQTIYTYSAVSVVRQPYETWSLIAGQIPLEQTVQYYDWGNTTTPIRTVTKNWYSWALGWSGLFTLQSMQTALENGQTTKTVYCYVGSNCSPNTFLPRLQEKDEYDYGQGTPGALIRKTVISYATFPATPIYPAGPSILDRPSSVITYGSAGRVSETDYSYDQNSVTPVSNLPAGTHDETNYGPSFNNRGNATTETVQCLQSCTNAVTTMTYDETGQVLTKVDPCGNTTCSDMPSGSSHTTTYSYLDNFDSPPSSNTNAYLTQITDPLGHLSKFKYAYSDGQLVQSQDQNDINASRSGTTYSYNDPLRRITETDFPDGGKTTITYNDAPYNPSTPSPSATTTSVMTSSTNLTSLSAFDGLGHTVRSVLTSDPDCASGDRTDTTYDGLSHVYTVSNSYCSTSDSTYGTTAYVYDALGRTTQVTHPDNSTMLITYTGRATQVQDEGNGTQRVARISQSDGLGHLTSVCEVSNASLIGSGGTPAACGLDVAGTGFLSTYQYDALDDLLQVNQSGIALRTFAYDSLSRLTSAGNPESATTSYSYDANGNVATKTDARNITITHTYNALNQLTGKTYSDGTPAVTFTYDETSARGVALTNTKGRLSSERTAGSLQTGAIFSYDPMGRIADNSQCTPQNCGTGVFALQYPQYDFLGDLISGTNAVGVTFTYSYNGAARLTGISSNYVDSSHPGTLFSQATYNAPGLLKTVLLGNGLTETRNYNSRLQLTSLTAGSAYSLSMVSYAPNGDVLAANDGVNGNWVYKYDDFNRLICSNLASNGTCLAPTSGTATYTYKHDRFGNRWQQNGPQSFVTTFTGNNPSNPQNNNRMDGYSYDAAGNLLSDGTHGYSYDAENRLTNVDNGTTASYVYDAEGRRVRKATASGTLDFLYDAQGHKVAEVDTTGTFQRGELYASGRHFAVFAPDPGPNGATFFIHADWLGTERTRTNMTGTACETIKSLPFGDGQTISDSCGDSAGDVSPMHFTGKERDSESGLDNFGARYNSSAMGRFMSPDPLGGHLLDPQTLNRYAYVRNNPVTLTDPTGLDFYLQCTDEKHNGCTQVPIDPLHNKNQTWVQADKNGNAKIITSDSIRAGYNTATVSENGVVINGKDQGIYFDNRASHTTDPDGKDVNNNPINLAGSGDLKDFSFTINGNCSGTCLSSGTWSFPGSLEDAREILYSRHSFSFPGEDEWADLGNGAHPYSTQHRFGSSWTCLFLTCTNSPHISVPNSWVPVPKDTVPQGFHVDAHGDMYHHGQDVKRQGVE